MDNETYKKAERLKNQIWECKCCISDWEMASSLHLISADKDGMNANAIFVEEEGYKEVSEAVIKMYEEKIKRLEIEFMSL